MPDIQKSETQVFDPILGFAPITDAYELTDATLAHRPNRWWLYLAGQRTTDAGVHLFSASLPEGAPLSATGWILTPDPQDPTRIALLASQENSKTWDLQGGRHCPSYVKGWDPHRREWVERIYYAGSAEQLWGPYTIGYLEWNGDTGGNQSGGDERWIDQPTPVFTANEPWERGSVYEPNLIYHDGKWKLWYVAGSNQDDYLVHGYSESEDGATNWTPHQLFAPPDLKLFDFCVLERPTGFEAIFSRVWVSKSAPPAETGLWWCHSKTPSPQLSDWSTPIQIMTAEDRGWHSAPWKPTFRYSDSAPNNLIIFFDGLRPTGDASPFPFAFTLGCLQISRPE